MILNLVVIDYRILLLQLRWRWGVKKSGFGKVYQDMGLEFAC
jgi:hypothetical protein